MYVNIQIGIRDIYHISNKFDAFSSEFLADYYSLLNVSLEKFRLMYLNVFDDCVHIKSVSITFHYLNHTNILIQAFNYKKICIHERIILLRADTKYLQYSIQKMIT